MYELYTHNEATTSKGYQANNRVRQVPIKNGVQKLAKRWFVVLAFICIGTSALAQVPEICGDGIDNDASGGDQLCDEPVKDLSRMHF